MYMSAGLSWSCAATQFLDPYPTGLRSQIKSTLLKARQMKIVNQMVKIKTYEQIKTWEHHRNLVWVHYLHVWWGMFYPGTKRFSRSRMSMRWNAGELLGAHFRSFERADPIKRRYWGFRVRFWLGFNVCAQRFSRIPPTSSPHASSWARKPLGTR